LKKALAVIDESIRDLWWGQPVTRKEATDAVFIYDHIPDRYREEIYEEVSRLRDQGDSGNSELRRGTK